MLFCQPNVNFQKSVNRKAHRQLFANALRSIINQHDSVGSTKLIILIDEAMEICMNRYLPSRTILHGSGILSSNPFFRVIRSGSIAFLKRPSYRSSYVGLIPANMRRFEDL